MTSPNLAETCLMEDDAMLLAILGVRVIEAPRLPEPVLLIKKHGIALVDSDLSREDRRAMLDRLVSHVARQAH